MAATAAVEPPGEDEGDGGYADGDADEDDAYVGIPVRFGIMQQRQLNMFPGDGKVGSSSSSQSSPSRLGEKAGARGW